MSLYEALPFIRPESSEGARSCYSRNWTSEIQGGESLNGEIVGVRQFDETADSNLTPHEEWIFTVSSIVATMVL